MKTGASDAFKHFNVGWGVGRSERGLVEFLGEPMAFRAEDPNIEKLKKVRSVRGKAYKHNAFVGSEMNKLPD